MSELVTGFMDEWLSDNLHISGYPQEQVPDPEAVILATQCITAAKKAGISKADLEHEYGDIPAFMHRRLERAVDAEVDRLAAKDD